MSDFPSNVGPFPFFCSRDGRLDGLRVDDHRAR
jgi:hypothetical protein